MELKDVIMSTLAEMEDTPVEMNSKTIEKKEVFKDVEDERESSNTPDSELLYLASIKERLLVLFEGFQAPNNTNIEAKVDMTLNFLEYTLATIETRIEKIEKGQR